MTKSMQNMHADMLKKVAKYDQELKKYDWNYVNSFYVIMEWKNITPSSIEMHTVI